MSTPTFVFFHVGGDTSLPEMLVASIHRTNPGAPVIHLSDFRTPRVPGVDGRMDFEGERGRIMRFRYECYAAAVERIEGVSILLDTDMLVVDRIDTRALFDARTEAVVCERFFSRDAPVNVDFRQMNMTEFAGMTLAQAWPFMGCFIATRSPRFMRALCDRYDTLQDKYKAWYGDQMALRAVISSGAFTIGMVSESEYACLVDARNPDRQLVAKAKILHFKGSAKGLMRPPDSQSI